MRALTFARLGTALAGAAVTRRWPSPGPPRPPPGTIMVPDDFNPVALRHPATGHYAVQGTGLRIWTDGSTSTDKVAEYVATTTPLADVGSRLVVTTHHRRIPPGFQLVVDFDNDGSIDGILVGEPTTTATTGG